ncbi:MAG: hypothetical protein ACI9M3_001757 [Bacteroidia bacterium]
MKRIHLFLFAVIYLVGCNPTEPRPRWNVKLNQKYRSGEIIKTDSSIIEYGKYRNFNQFYEITKNDDTLTFISYTTITDSIEKNINTNDFQMNLGLISIRDSTYLHTPFGTEKIIKIYTNNAGLSDATATTYFLSSGRPILYSWDSWARYFTYSHTKQDQAIIEALEKDTTGFFHLRKPPLPVPPGKE